MIPYDNTPGIGWGPFKLAPDHVFTPCAAIHDAQYDWLIAGTSPLTLRQIDKAFLTNCLHVAAMQKDAGDRERYRREAYIFYFAVRAWAKLARKNLEAFKPKGETSG